MANRIILADDDPIERRMLQQGLSKPDLAIETFPDGEAALRAFDESGAELVISDIMMPGMQGTELLRELRRRAPSLPVILMTSHGSVKAAVTALHEGAFNYVTKPIDVGELQTLIERALKIERLERENR